jgi:hypothetical protein
MEILQSGCAAVDRDRHGLGHARRGHRLVETLIAKVSESDWPVTRKRLEAWVALRPNWPGKPMEDKS